MIMKNYSSVNTIDFIKIMQVHLITMTKGIYLYIIYCYVNYIPQFINIYELTMYVYTYVYFLQIYINEGLIEKYNSQNIKFTI